MPLTKEQRAKYPADWKEVRERVLARASLGEDHPRCECQGECGAHRPVPLCECGHERDAHLEGGHCTICPNVRGRRCGAFVYTHAVRRRCVEVHGALARFFEGMVVLTVAHLWRGPCSKHAAEGVKCGDESHVKAMCQACHLRYDMPHHKANAAATRRAKKQNHEMPLGGDA